MSRARSLLLTLLIALIATPAFAQDAKPDLAELWRVGSLWQVGDNRDRVDEARKAIIAAGEDGLKFALTRLNASTTLEIRCLNAVIAGFGESSASGPSKKLAEHKAAEAFLLREKVWREST